VPVSFSMTSSECCFDFSEVLGLLRLALWPPMMFPMFDMVILVGGGWKWCLVDGDLACGRRRVCEEKRVYEGRKEFL